MKCLQKREVKLTLGAVHSFSFLGQNRWWCLLRAELIEKWFHFYQCKWGFFFFFDFLFFGFLVFLFFFLTSVSLESHDTDQVLSLHEASWFTCVCPSETSVGCRRAPEQPYV